MNDLKKFIERGHEVFTAGNREKLDRLRASIFDSAKQMVPYGGEAMDDFFNQFHRYSLAGAGLNRVRVGVIDHATRELEVAQTLFDCFEPTLRALVGPDVVAQKTVNLVIQQPGDPDQVPIHRDAPLNSNYELIVWLPLVDVYGTKGMFIMDRPESLEGVRMLKAGKSYQEFCDYTAAHSNNLVVPYGAACFFAGGIAHGCHVNTENETRWSLNIRYKNLFTPYGSKGLAEFFTILRSSPLTDVAFQFDLLEHELRER